MMNYMMNQFLHHISKFIKTCSLSFMLSRYDTFYCNNLLIFFVLCYIEELRFVLKIVSNKIIVNLTIVLTALHVVHQITIQKNNK